MKAIKVLMNAVVIAFAVNTVSANASAKKAAKHEAKRSKK